MNSDRLPAALQADLLLNGFRRWWPKRGSSTAAEAAEHEAYHMIVCTGMQDRRRAAVMLIFTMNMILLLPSFNTAAGNRCTTRWNALLQRAETRCDNGSSTVSRYNRWLGRWETHTMAPARKGSPSTRRCITTYNRGVLWKLGGSKTAPLDV
jgi:hypothetical protein